MLRNVRTHKRVLWSALVTLLIGLQVALGAHAFAQPNLTYAPEGVRDVTTVTTRIAFGEQPRTSKQGVWLAGFASKAQGAPTALSVTFSQVAAGWLGPLWGLQLQSDMGLIPGRLNPQEGSDFLQGSEFILLQTLAPKWGHEYEVKLGYDPATGAASVQLMDLTAGQVVFARNLQLEPYGGPLFPAAGVAEVTESGLDEPTAPVATVEAFNADEALVPVRVSWWIMQRETPDDSFLTAVQIDRRQETIFRVHMPWEELRPEVGVRLLDPMDAPVSYVPYDYEIDYTPIQVAGLSPGTYTAVLEYTFRGQTWELDRRSITIGVIEVDVARLEAKLQGQDTILLDGVLHVQSDGRLDDVLVGLQASLVHHTFTFNPGTTRGTMLQSQSEPIVLMDPVSLQMDSESVLAFTAELPLPEASTSTSLWEVRVLPFSNPDPFLSEGMRYNTWIGAATSETAWTGFLQNEVSRKLTLAPGVEVVSLSGRIAAGPLRMQLLIADLTTPGVSVDALVGQVLTTPASSRWPRSQVSQMVEMSGAVAGVNSAFFDISNTMNPLGIVMRSGRLLKTEMGGQPAHIGVDINGNPYIGYWQWSGVVQRPDGGEFRPVVGINVTTPGSGLVIYRAPAMRSLGNSDSDIATVELVLTELPDEATASSPWDPSTARVIRGVVQEVRHNLPGVPLRDGMFVLAGGGENAEYLLSTFQVGDVVEIPYRLTGGSEWPYLSDWQELYAAVSGGAVLLRNGVYGAGIITNTDRHPRTAVGISLDQSKLYVLVADGRSATSVGMTYQEMADFFRYLGAFHALNLDGGGSTAMAVRDPLLGRVNVLNTPSDGQQRYVPDGLGIFYAAPVDVVGQ